MTLLRSLLCVLTTSMMAVPGLSQARIQDPHSAALALPATPADAEGHPVLVRDPKGKPVAGASVLVVDYKKLGRKLRRETLQEARKRFAGDAEAGVLLMAAKHGRRYVTDASGKTSFARVQRGLVVAVSGSLVVHTSVMLRSGREPRQLNLQLRAVPGIDVLVVDSRGRPVKGVPVSVQYRARSFDYQSWRPRDENRRTNAQGRVRLDELRGYSDSMAAYVTLRVPKAEPNGVEVDEKTFQNDPAKPIKLVLPDYGSVRVMVEDPEKRPVENLTQVLMHLSSGSSGRTIAAHSVDRGFATFDFVPIGLQFEISCQVDKKARPNRIAGIGPRHPRDMRVLRLSGVTSAPILTFRILDQKKKPLANETLGLILSSARSTLTTTVKLNREGRGSITLGQAHDPEGEGLLTLTRRNKSRSAFYLGAVQLPFERIGTRRALGDLTLRDEALLVRGRAVAPDGKPLAGVDLTVPHSYNFSRRNSYFYSLTSERLRFYQHVVRTDKDGRFEFRQIGEPPADFVISVATSGNNQNYVVAEGEDPDVGATDHKVVLQRTGSLRGSVTGAPNGQNQFGSIRLLDDSDTPVKTSVRQRADGAFEMRGCRPGTYSLTFKAMGADKPFLVIDKLKIVAGQVCTDPRIQKIDLSKHCKFATITVLKPDGKPLANAGYSIITRKKNGFSSHGSSANPEGKFNVIRRELSVDVSINDSKKRFKQVRLEKVQKDMVVKLEPAWKLNLSVTGMPKLPPKIRFRVAIRRQGGGAGKQWPGSFFIYRNLGLGNTQTQGVDRDGKYTVSIRPRNVDGEELDLDLPTLSGSFEIKPNQPTNKPIDLKIACSAEEIDMIETAIKDLAEEQARKRKR